MLENLIGRFGIGRFPRSAPSTPLLLKSPLSRLYPDRASLAAAPGKPLEIKNIDKKSRKQAENNGKIEV